MCRKNEKESKILPSMKTILIQDVEGKSSHKDSFEDELNLFHLETKRFNEERIYL